MAGERAQNLQDTFLNYVRKNKVPLTIFLVNGVKLQGVVSWFDNFCLLLRRDGHSQLVYKHAISTIMPGAPIQMFEQGEEGGLSVLKRVPSELQRVTFGSNSTVEVKEHDRDAPTRALVIGPYLNERKAAFDPATGIRPPSGRSPEARLDEAAGLARAIDLDVVAAQVAMLSKLRPATYIGLGKVEEFAALVKEKDVEIVIVDCALSPVQQRNLEKELHAKVIDRTGLILEIFGRRARTREGALQVELAHLAYQRSRLVRSWTHLERQRGGFGFLGGPGETQIEADRRLIQERILKIERDLEGVKKTRGLHRAKRQAVPYPVVALVGYTNAGKSTLFNRLTRAEVLAKDMLFATLDPTLRAVALPHGEKIMLSDTVGFISDLPTQLVSAFRATLEEVVEADLVLHVRDLSHEDTDAQSSDVEQVLGDLGIDPNDGHFIEVWNKIDLLEPSQAEALRTSVSRRPADERPFVVSALTGEGVGDLLAGIEARLSRDHVTFELRLGPQEQDQLGWIYDNLQVLSREPDDEGSVHFTLRVAPDMIDRLERRLPQAQRVVERRKRGRNRPAAE